MSSFGDFVDEDAYDPEPADPYQVAVRLHRYRFDADLEDFEWDALPEPDRVARIEVIARLIHWLRISGSAR